MRASRLGIRLTVALLAPLFCLAVAIQHAPADEAWPQFRGPGGQGHAEASKLPTSWSETENVRWSVEIPGRGWSSPVVDGGQIWLTTAIERAADEALSEKKRKGSAIAGSLEVAGHVTLKAVCVDWKSGKILHEITLFEVEEPEAIHKLNSFASPTPILQDGRVYCHFGSLGTACVDVAIGKALWKTKLPLVHGVGPGSSPAAYGELLIIPCDGVDRQYVVALDMQTGEEVWKTVRPPMRQPSGDRHKAYCTPLVLPGEDGDQVIIPGAQWVCSYEPTTGKELWRCDYDSGFSNVPRPVVGHGMTYICTGFMRPELWAIKLGGSGDVTETHVAWKKDQQIPTMPSPLLVGDEIYIISDRGIATCFDAATGEERWKERISGNYSASPLFVNGRIYFFSHEGKATIIEPGTKYRELATCELPGSYMATPAVVDNALIVRTDKKLYRIEAK